MNMVPHSLLCTVVHTAQIPTLKLAVNKISKIWHWRSEKIIKMNNKKLSSLNYFHILCVVDFNPIYNHRDLEIVLRLKFVQNTTKLVLHEKSFKLICKRSIYHCCILWLWSRLVLNNLKRTLAMIKHLGSNQ